MSEQPRCAGCDEPHWYNFWVPDDVWARICPLQPFTPEQQGGVLCARCIDRRCADAGITEVVGRFSFTGHSVATTPVDPPEAFDPLAVPPGEYEAGQIIRKAVEHDPSTMRFYLTCSVGELAQRIVAASGEREGALNGSATPTTVTTESPVVVDPPERVSEASTLREILHAATHNPADLPLSGDPEALYEAMLSNVEAITRRALEDTKGDG